MTRFEIADTNTDGTQRSNTQLAAAKEEESGVTQTPDKKGKNKITTQAKSNAMKIQFLLDQRKPPTEKLPSLCAQYDDDLNKICDAAI